MFTKRSRYICFHSWKSLDVKAGLSRILSIMATSPSLACERKGTSKELMQMMSHWQNQPHGWKERMGGTNWSLGDPESTGTTCSVSTHKQEPFLQCHTVPWGTWASLALSRTLKKSFYSPTCPLVQPQKKQALHCLLWAACISQDGFHTTKCHLFAPGQHQKHCVGVWDADTHTASRPPAQLHHCPRLVMGHPGSALQRLVPWEWQLILTTACHGLAGCNLFLPLMWQREGRNRENVTELLVPPHAPEAGKWLHHDPSLVIGSWSWGSQ